ncbi:copper chaperone PCu(A)C [Fodinibius salsisoli]|uniref:Copper chaperone PCu(A)C n=1 Tax=Fodinibius salsisoli TaxID=2820877 RepID=A0ABT3PMB9_9BACT|nr:copper chaperone PCu(A)C [Fodinibius salsisoli]MCW9707092.1 copper chaperone PCu(A)C [Fodinibius salsisoli]
MFSTRLFCLTVFLVTTFLIGCSSGDPEKEPVILGKIELSDGWARPAAQGQSSAVYMSISNGTASRDSISNIASPIAANAGIHETYKGENGIIGMRPAPGQVIPSGEDLYFKPNGLHIMLMKLKEDLAVGDSIDVDITFNRVGTHSIRVPVKVQQ